MRGQMIFQNNKSHSDPFPWDLLSACGVRDFFSCAPRYIKVRTYVPYFFNCFDGIGFGLICDDHLVYCDVYLSSYRKISSFPPYFSSTSTCLVISVFFDFATANATANHVACHCAASAWVVFFSTFFSFSLAPSLSHFQVEISAMNADDHKSW